MCRMLNERMACEIELTIIVVGQPSFSYICTCRFGFARSTATIQPKPVYAAMLSDTMGERKHSTRDKFANHLHVRLLHLLFRRHNPALWWILLHVNIPAQWRSIQRSPSTKPMHIQRSCKGASHTGCYNRRGRRHHRVYEYRSD